MSVPKTETPDDPSAPAPRDTPAPPGTTEPAAPNDTPAGLRISSVTDAVFGAAAGTTNDGAEAVRERGLVISSVRDAVGAQATAVAALDESSQTTGDSDTSARSSHPRIEGLAARTRIALPYLGAALVVLYGTALAWAAPLIGHGGIDPWPAYVGMGVVGALALAARHRVRSRVGSAVLWLLALFWVSWIATLPFGAYWDPATRASANAQASVYASALVMLALVGLGAARPSVFRWLWLAVVLTTMPLALREALFADYLYPWNGVAGAPVAVFVNPNNYATILVLMVGVAAGWMTERLPRVGRWSLGALTAVCVWLVVATTSRAALVGTALVLLMALLLLAERRGWRQRMLAALPSRSRSTGLRAVGLAAILTALLVVAFAVPSLAARNPVLLALFPGDEETVRSDGLRARFVGFALERWRERPWYGTGAGTFERLWTSGAEPGAPRPSVPPHNGFVEILSENGLVVAVPLLLLLAALSWRAIRPLAASLARAVLALNTDRRQVGSVAPASSGLPAGLDPLGASYLVGVHLVAFALAGTVVSSPLPWFPWWTMLAGAVAFAAFSPSSERTSSTPV